MSDPRDVLAALMLDMYKIEPRTRALEMADAILAAGWRAPVPHCDHDWSTDRDMFAGGGEPWRECLLCGKQENEEPLRYHDGRWIVARQHPDPD